MRAAAEWAEVWSPLSVQSRPAGPARTAGDNNFARFSTDIDTVTHGMLH